MFQRRVVFATVVAAAVCLVTGVVLAGDGWKEVPDPDELMLEEEFKLDPNARLQVNVSDVHVDLVQVDDNVATVKVYASARSEDKAREYFEKLHMKVVEDDNTVKVMTSRSMFRGSISWGWSSRVRVRAIITIPRGTDMRVKTDDGDIRAGALAGRLDAHTSDGSILIERIDAPSVVLKTSDGNVRVDRIEADDVQVRSSDGNVHAEAVVGKEISFSTSDGDVTIDRAEVEELYASSSDGDVTVDELAGTKMRGRTSDGDIRVTLGGDVALDLRTSDGDIHIYAPRGLRADLNLKGERIHLSGNIEIDGEISRRRARGSVGGGGVEIVARTSDGSVSFEQRR
jgi:hypothetical protein